MKAHRQSGPNARQEGSALLIAIFALLLISVVGIALLISSSADSALAGNYRTSTAAYYAAVAGLEEARGRLLWKNPDFLNTTVANFIPMAAGTPALGLTQVRYILNPAGGETVDPTSPTPSSYPDTEYPQEFGWPLSSTNVQTINSVSSASGIPGPLFKWVRISAVTEYSLNLDVNNDGVIDTATPLLYDPANADPSYNPKPGLVFPSTPQTPTAVQALELTAYAVLPDGSKRLLQYVVAPLIVSTQVSSNAANPLNLNFPAALTLAASPAGSGVTFTGPGPGSTFKINGEDACSPVASPVYVYSIASTNSFDQSRIVAAAIPAGSYTGYPGTVGPPPAGSPSPTSIGDIDVTPATALIRPNWLTPSGLDSTVQDITRSADVVFNGSVNGNTNLTPLSMTALNPLTIVVNGNLDLTGWHNSGFGVLLVTGTLNYDPDATWNGIVLVIGQGNFVSTLGGSGGFNGAVFIAKTRDSSGNLLPALGAASYSQTGGGSPAGISYSTCWISQPIGPTQTPIQGPLSYKVLSFREITPP